MSKSLHRSGRTAPLLTKIGRSASPALTVTAGAPAGMSRELFHSTQPPAVGGSHTVTGTVVEPEAVNRARHRIAKQQSAC